MFHISRKKHPEHPYLHHQDRGNYTQEYHNAVKLTNTKVSIWREDRYMNLISFLHYTSKLEGSVIECGVWKGLSAYLMCEELERQGRKDGEDFFIVDGFQGLPDIAGVDTGMFAFSMDEVKNNLKRFPKINYTKGWIPEVFSSLPKRQYKFVHIDLDLAVPVVASFEFFYPQLVKGGVMVSDDYSATHWRPLKEEVDKWCAQHNLNPIRLSSGQLVVIKE